MTGNKSILNFFKVNKPTNEDSDKKKTQPQVEKDY